MKVFKYGSDTISTAEENDNREVEAVKHGDKSAFRDLMNKYSHFVAASVYRVLWNNEDTADVVQETFIKVWKNIARYNDDSKFSTWLYKIAINTAYDKLRSRKRKQLIFTGIDEKLIDSLNTKEPVDVVDNLSDKELVKIIMFLADSLSPVQKMIFTLVDIEKHRIRETAEILNMNESTVKANLSHARKKIRLKLANYIKED